MSIPWATLKPALLTLVSELAGGVVDMAAVPPVMTKVLQTEEDQTEQSFVGNEDIPDAKALVSFVARDTASYSSEFLELVKGDNGPLYENVTASQPVSMIVKVQTFDQTPLLWSEQYLERLRTRLFWQSTYDLLFALDVAIISISDTKDDPSVVDERVTSCAYLTVELNVETVEIDPTPYSRIESVEVTETT